MPTIMKMNINHKTRVHLFPRSTRYREFPLKIGLTIKSESDGLQILSLDIARMWILIWAEAVELEVFYSKEWGIKSLKAKGLWCLHSLFKNKSL